MGAMRVEMREVGSSLSEQHRLADRIDDMSPGCELAGLLDQIDRAKLNGFDLVRVIRARARQVAYDQAQMMADTVELGYSPPSHEGSPPRRQQEPDSYLPDELRVALRWTARSADSFAALAYGLVERLPRVWEALAEGRIDLPRARVFFLETGHIDVDYAREVADRILPEAPELTTGQIGARLRRLCLEADPDAARRDYEKAVDERRVEAFPNQDGTAELVGYSLPPDRVSAIMGRIQRLARKLRRKGDPRTMDQLRADIFMDLLDRRDPTSNERAIIDIRVDLPTLLDLAERAGEIPGWGPVISDIARQAVEGQPDGQWRVAVTDPDTGAVLWDGTTRRRPTTVQRRYIEVREPTCMHPSCRRPATNCEMDHSIDYAKGGPTEVHNLGPGCGRDHDLKTNGGWRLVQPRPGMYVWTSRHGHTYVVERRPP